MLNVKVKKFNQARVNGGSNYDSTFRGSWECLFKASASQLKYIGDTDKLRGLPKDFNTKQFTGNGTVAELTATGMVKA